MVIGRAPSSVSVLGRGRGGAEVGPAGPLVPVLRRGGGSGGGAKVHRVGGLGGRGPGVGRAGGASLRRPRAYFDLGLSGSGSRLRLDPAVRHANRPVTERREPRLVGDEEEGRLPFAAPGEEVSHHLVAGCGVEVPGRLVREEKVGTVDEGAGDGDALLLAARKLARIVPQAVVEPHCGELLARPLEGVGGARELARGGHVLDGGHGGDEVEGLEHDADVGPPEPRERVLVEGREVFPRHLDPARGRPFETADDHEQGRLAGPGRPDDAHRLAGGEVEVDAAQDLHRTGRAGQGDGKIVQRYDGAMDGGGHGGSWVTGRWRAGYQWRKPVFRHPLGSLLIFTRSPQTASVALLAVTFPAVALLVALMAPAHAGGGALRILMLGDSLTAGYGLASRDALPARLEAALGAHRLDARVIDAGVSGDTTSGGLARVDWALADDPHAVIVALGANDGLRAIDPAVTRANLDRLLGILAERGLPALLAGMVAPPNLGPEYAARFDPIYRELAARHGAILYPFLLDGVATVTLLNQEDGIHPNPAGVEEIVRRMLPAVLCLARRAGHPPDQAMAEAAGLAAGGAGLDCE